MMTDQLEIDFGVYATAACNHARRLNAPPVPDADGLFDVDGVAIICGRRQCAVEPDGELFATVQFNETKIKVTAIAPGRWDPVAILSACTKAHGNRVYAVDYETAKPTNPNGLDELRIARVVGADGIRPYLSRKSRYAGLEGDSVRGPLIMPPRQHVLPDTLRQVLPGHMTWSFRCVMQKDYGPDGHWLPRTSDYNVRRALRALEDAGLVHIELGPRGGMATAKVTWLPRAYLAPERLAPADEEAMGMLA